MPPPLRYGIDTAYRPKSRLSNRVTGSTPSIVSRSRAARSTTSWPNAPSMIDRHADRW